MRRQETEPLPPEGAPDLDELQRGQEQPVTVETLEPPPSVYPTESREVMVPDPGERPDARGRGARCHTRFLLGARLSPRARA